MHSEDEGLGNTKYKVRFGVNQSVCSLSLMRLGTDQSPRASKPSQYVDWVSGSEKRA